MATLTRRTPRHLLHGGWLIALVVLVVVLLSGAAVALGHNVWANSATPGSQNQTSAGSTRGPMMRWAGTR